MDSQHEGMFDFVAERPMALAAAAVLGMAALTGCQAKGGHGNTSAPSAAECSNAQKNALRAHVSHDLENYGYIVDGVTERIAYECHDGGHGMSNGAVTARLRLDKCSQLTAHLFGIGAYTNSAGRSTSFSWEVDKLNGHTITVIQGKPSAHDVVKAVAGDGGANKTARALAKRCR